MGEVLVLRRGEVLVVGGVVLSRCGEKVLSVEGNSSCGGASSRCGGASSRCGGASSRCGGASSRCGKNVLTVGRRFCCGGS